MKIPHRFYAVLFLPIKVCKCPRSCPYLRFKHKLAVKQRKLGLSDSLASNNPTSGKKFRVKSAETRGRRGRRGENRSRCRFVWRGLSRANTGHVSLASLGKTKLESSNFLALFLSQSALKKKNPLCSSAANWKPYTTIFLSICFVRWCRRKKLGGGGGPGVGGMRDLIDNWWIPINLSFLSSGATQWSRGDALSSEKWPGPKITQRAAGRGNCPCPSPLSFSPPIHSQPGMAK